MALQLHSAEERFAETRHGAEQLLNLQRTLSKYVAPLLRHITELEEEIERLRDEGWDRSELKGT